MIERGADDEAVSVTDREEAERESVSRVRVCVRDGEWVSRGREEWGEAEGRVRVGMWAKLVRVWVRGDVVRDVDREDVRVEGELVGVEVEVEDTLLVNVAEDDERVLEMLVLFEDVEVDVVEVVDNVDMLVEEFVEVHFEEDEGSVTVEVEDEELSDVDELDNELEVQLKL
ncbi:hypothetical protein FS837_000611 [Tulasnella sp. UAMH 9824]|nr:hypothetical protein FS837_000611 [Tulasnella sp. UAMH 9824]